MIAYALALRDLGEYNFTNRDYIFVVIFVKRNSSSICRTRESSSIFHVKFCNVLKKGVWSNLVWIKHSFALTRKIMCIIQVGWVARSFKKETHNKNTYYKIKSSNACSFGNRTKVFAPRVGYRVQLNLMCLFWNNFIIFSNALHASAVG